MADKEISALPTSASLNPSDWFHVKQGTTDVKMNIATILNTHINSANPHNVTKAQVGLTNVADAEQLEKALNLSDLPSASTARTNLDVYSISEVQTQVNNHANLTNNPHSVTKSQVGLGNVANYTTTNDPRENTTTKYATGAAVATLAAEFDAKADPIPIGAIVMWSQNAGALPTGYALCNGQTAGGIVTPDLSGKFIKAGTVAQSGDLGGSNTIDHTHSGTTQGHALTLDQIPEHQHGTGWGENPVYPSLYGFKDVNQPILGSGKSDFDNREYLSEPVGGGLPHNHAMSVDSVSLSNEPEYYVLAFIMRYE